jgi:hypothetical protein
MASCCCCCCAAAPAMPAGDMRPCKLSAGELILPAAADCPAAPTPLGALLLPLRGLAHEGPAVIICCCTCCCDACCCCCCCRCCCFSCCCRSACIAELRCSWNVSGPSPRQRSCRYLKVALFCTAGSTAQQQVAQLLVKLQQHNAQTAGINVSRMMLQMCTTCVHDITLSAGMGCLLCLQHLPRYAAE